MKVLVVCSEPPLTEGRAAAKCTVAMIRGLKGHGLEVRVLAARQHFAIPGEPPADLAASVIDVRPEPGGWRSRLARLRMPMGELARSPFRAHVEAASHDVDVVHLLEPDVGWCDVGVDTPTVAGLHFLVRRDRMYGAPWKQESRRLLEMDLAERAFVRRHQFLVASSSVVAEELQRRHSKDVTHAPLCLDPTDYAPAPLDGPPTAGIIGTASWPPTASAMRRLVEEVWPLVRARAPDARLLIAGRGTSGLGLRGDGVEVVGEVTAATQFLHRLSVLLYPLSRGSGMKVKTMEAAACGVPVVTTPEGGEGLELGAGMVVADSTAELVEATVSLLGDSDERRRRGAAAREHFTRRYSPGAATQPLVTLYQRLASP